MYLTFLFADVTELPDNNREAASQYIGVLAEVLQILTGTCLAGGGDDIRSEGNNVLAAFNGADNALDAAVAGLQAVFSGAKHDGIPIGVRVGVHSGSAQRTASGFVGLGLNEAARVSALAQPGQILVSETAMREMVSTTAADVTLQSVGRHKLKDLPHPLELFQVRHPSLPDDLAPTVGREVYLPHYQTRFVGPNGHTDHLLRQLEADEHIVTLTGPAGVGKTRLAIEAAKMLAHRFADGVRLYDARNRPADEIMASITAASSLSASPRHAGRSQLIVLDNLEYLLDDAAPLLEQFAQSRRSKVLVTSCEALRIPGEIELRVAPLESETWEDEAPRLYTQLIANSSHSRSEDNEAAVVALCQELDGLPLAIEAAAQQGEVQTAEALLAALVADSHALIHWLSPLFAALERQYGLLKQSEAEVLLRLAVLPGDVTVKGAMDLLCEGENNGLDVLGFLDSLIAKNFVQPAGESGQLTILRTTRRFLLQKRLPAEV